MTGDERFLDALAELVGIGVGKAAEVLNAMLRSHIVLSVPSIRIVAPDELPKVLGLPADRRLAAVEMGYSGSLSGSVELIFTQGEAGRLVECITGEVGIPEEDLDAVRAGTLAEVGNIVINALLGSVSNVLGLELTYTVPAYLEGGLVELLREARVVAGGSAGEEVVLLARTRFQVEELAVDGDIAVFFALDSFRSLEAGIAAYLG